MKKNKEKKTKKEVKVNNDDFNLDDFDLDSDLDDILGDLDIAENIINEKDEPNIEEIEEEKEAEAEEFDEAEEVVEEEREETGILDDLDFDFEEFINEDDKIDEETENEPNLPSENENTPQISVPTSEEVECPTCNTILPIHTTYCSECGTKLNNSTTNTTTPLLSKANEPCLMDSDTIDFSDAIPSDKTIVIKSKDGYKALTKIDKELVYPIICEENMAKTLVADHVLRTSNADTETKINLFSYLKNEKFALHQIYGTDNLNEIYGEDVDSLLEFADMEGSLLSLPLKKDILRVFKKASKKDQKIIADCLKDFMDLYELDNIPVTKPTAMEIMFDVQPDKIKKILADEARIYFIMKGMM